jgi:Asp/Glu/hydantoin racemase
VRLLLVNPNTSAATTQAMLVIAREAAPAGVAVDGLTAPFGESLITTEAALTTATEAVVALLTPERINGFDGVIIAAFGDPGLARLRNMLPVPVTGIAEASMAEAAEHGLFSVATTTPELATSITRSAFAYGHGPLFLGVALTPGDPHALMTDGARLVAALEDACWAAIRDGAQAIVIGGGPLAVAARTLRPRIPVPIVEPVPAALRLAVTRSESSVAEPVQTAR